MMGRRRAFNFSAAAFSFVLAVVFDHWVAQAMQAAIGSIWLFNALALPER